MLYRKKIELLSKNKLLLFIIFVLFTFKTDFIKGESLGENLSKWWGSSDSESDSDGSKAVEMWYSEINLYDFSINAFQYSAGHFSQLVNIFFDL